MQASTPKCDTGLLHGCLLRVETRCSRLYGVVLMRCKGNSQLSGIYKAIENLPDKKASQRKWDDRERIGFKK